MSSLRRLGIIAALVVAGSLSGCVVARRPPPPPAPVGEAAIESWERRHPAASRELGSWVRAHPPAASRFFVWDSHHPGAAEEFVNWSLAFPGADIDVFAASHRGWEEFNWIMEHHRPAANAFMAWCRRHPEASRELMHHPGGLHWAGTHLYQSYWDMKSAG